MRRLPLPALLLALTGYWLPWLTHPAAALRLNGYELSEWITFLPAVRSGEASLSRLAFLLPLACLAVLCALVAARPASPLGLSPLGIAPRPAPRQRRSGLLALLPAIAGPGGWALLLAGLVCAYTVFPPYPYLLTAHADPEYRWQLALALLTVFAFIAVVYVPRELNAFLQILFALAAAIVAVTALLALRPEANQALNAPWPLGPGWPLLLVGFTLLALGGLARLFGPRE